MGDRTTVTLNFLSEHTAQVATIAGVKKNCVEEYGGLSSITFEEINYGTLQFLRELRAAGIAYDSAWGAGSEYREGCEHCRFTEQGGIEIKTLYDGDENPEMHTLLALIDKPVELRQCILDHKKYAVEPSWDNQVEYGKRYMTLQLITT
jgi:hypothetical protein